MFSSAKIVYLRKGYLAVTYAVCYHMLGFLSEKREKQNLKMEANLTDLYTHNG